jgi:hypothetical protein
MKEFKIPEDKYVREDDETTCEEIIVEQFDADDLIFLTQEDEEADGTKITATHMLTVKQARMLREALDQIFGDA